MAGRLRRALECLQRVPSDLGETYEAVYGHIRAGRVLPKDGDFLRGAPAREMPLPARPPERRSR